MNYMKIDYKTMKMRKLLSLFWCLVPEVLWGNIVTGHVVDTDNMPIEFANVVVLALSCHATWPHVPRVAEDDLKLLISPAHSCAEILGTRQASY